MNSLVSLVRFPQEGKDALLSEFVDFQTTSSIALEIIYMKE